MCVCVCVYTYIKKSVLLFSSVQGGNNNNIFYSSQRETEAVVRSHNEEHISIILSHEKSIYAIRKSRNYTLHPESHKFPTLPFRRFQCSSEWQ